MFRRVPVSLIATIGGVAVIGAMLLIPGGEKAASVDAPVVTALTHENTIATIDAMLAASQQPAVEVAVDRPVDTPARPADPNLQTAALTTPETDLEGAPISERTLRPDAIGSSAVNLRAGPSSSTATVTVLRPGQPVEVGESDGGWVEVTLPDGTTGWVFARYLASVAATAAPAPTKSAQSPAAGNTETTATRATIQGKGQGNIEGRTARIDATLTARSKPDGKASRVFSTTPGERVRILDVRGNWLRIQTSSGNSGWIQAS